MANSNDRGRPQFDDVATSRAGRKALRDATDHVDDASVIVTSNGTHIPKLSHDGELAEATDLPEWVGTDEQIEVPAADQFSWGAAGGAIEPADQVWDDTDIVHVIEGDGFSAGQDPRMDSLD